MAISTTDSLLEALEKSNLLDSDQLTQAREFALQVADARALAKKLVSLGWLTRWQSELLLAGRTSFMLGKYKLMELLGRGGMGNVYLARHTMMNRPVALKIISKQLGRDPANLERFFSEARSVAALNHPNIVHAYNIDNEGDRYYMVMEFVEGQDLQRMVEDHGPLDCTLAADCIRQAADGLAHAHSRNIIHCDVKPANLLVNTQGVVKILDMGMARLVSTEVENGAAYEQVLGTVDYMAPELAMQSPHVDRRADIYSLGCTLYFLLTGRPPFPEGSLAERIVKHQMQEPRPIFELRPDAPRDLVAICQRMMAKRPEDRFQLADDIVARLSERELTENDLIRTIAIPEETKKVSPPVVAVPSGIPPAGSASDVPPVARKIPELVDPGKDLFADSGLEFAGEALPPVESVIATSSSAVKRPAKKRQPVIALAIAGGLALVVLVVVVVLIISSGSDSHPAPRDTNAANGASAPPAPTAAAPANAAATPSAATSNKPPDSSSPSSPAPPAKSSLPAVAQSAPKAPEPAAPSGVPDANKVVAEIKRQQDEKLAQLKAKIQAAQQASQHQMAQQAAQQAAKPGPPPGAPPATASAAAPKAPEKNNPPAPLPKPDPLASIPAQLDLPLVSERGNAVQPVPLGKVALPPGVDLQVELLGGDVVLAGGRKYRLQRTGAPPDSANWMIRLEIPVAGASALAVDVARLWRAEDASLLFQWAANVKPEDANYLRNCVLRFRAQDAVRELSLMVPETLSALALSVERASYNMFELKWVPPIDNLKVEVTKVGGPQPSKLDPDQPVGFDMPVRVTYLRKDRANGDTDGAVFTFKAVVRSKGESYSVHLTLQDPPLKWWRQFEMNSMRLGGKGGFAEARRRIVDDQAKFERQLKDAEAKEGTAKELQQLESQLRKLDAQLWYMDFCQAVQSKANVQFRIFLPVGDRQAVLASTLLPAPDSAADARPPK